MEGELAGITAENRSLERENKHLRDIVENFIESKGQNDSTVDFPMTSDVNEESPFKRSKTLYNAGEAQLKSICNLDTDMNDLLVSVLKEEDRQRFVLKEFMDLLDRNSDLLGISSDTNARGERVVRPTTCDAGIQSDEIIGQGVVKILEPDEDEALPAIPSTLPPPAPKQKTVSLGSDLPLLLRKKFSSFPRVLRIPPIKWTVNALFSVYFAMIRHQDMQNVSMTSVSSNALGNPKVSLWEFAYDFYVKQFNIPPVAEIGFSQLLRSCDHYIRNNKSVLVFALQMGLTSKEVPPEYDAADTDFILKVIKCLSQMGQLISDLNSEAFDAALDPSKHGMSVASAPPLSKAHQAPGFSMSQSILSVGSNQKHSIRLSQTNAHLVPGELRTEILRSSAVATTRSIFEKWFPDKGEDCAMKVEAMPASKRDGINVSIHDYMEITLDQWKGVRLVWLDHIQYLFSTYCCVYHAITPLTYFNDLGSRGRDTVLTLTNRSAPGEPKKRVVDYFERLETAAKINELPRTKSRSDDGSGNEYSRDWVFELIPKKHFGSVLKLLKPDISEHEVSVLFLLLDFCVSKYF